MTPASHLPRLLALHCTVLQIKMLLGTLPSDTLLREYRLTEYTDIRTAVATGDVALLNRVLSANQAQFVQAGTYLLLEKLQLAVYRRLFKRWVWYCGVLCWPQGSGLMSLHGAQLLNYSYNHLVLHHRDDEIL